MELEFKYLGRNQSPIKAKDKIHPDFSRAKILSPVFY